MLFMYFITFNKHLKNNLIKTHFLYLLLMINSCAKKWVADFAVATTISQVYQIAILISKMNEWLNLHFVLIMHNYLMLLHIYSSIFQVLQSF